jgi:hypothetical protein
MHCRPDCLACTAILVVGVLLMALWPARSHAQVCVDIPDVIFNDVLPYPLSLDAIHRLSSDGKTMFGSIWTGAVWQFFRWSPGVLELLPEPAERFYIVDVSANLKYAIGYISISTGSVVYQRWDIDGNTFQTIPKPTDPTHGEADRSDVFGVANDGTVFSTAFWDTDTNPFTYEIYRPHRWTGSGNPKPMGEGNTCLLDISEDGTIAIGGCGLAGYWTEASDEWKTLEGLPDGLENITLMDLSPDGTYITGEWTKPDTDGDGFNDARSSFRWSAPDQYTPLDGPPAPGSAIGRQVIDDGTVFGSQDLYTGDDFTFEEVVWPGGSTSSESQEAWFASQGFTFPSGFTTEGLTATGDGRTFSMQPGIVRLDGGCTPAFQVAGADEIFDQHFLPGATGGKDYYLYIDTSGLEGVDLAFSPDGVSYTALGAAIPGEPITIPNPECEEGEGGECPEPFILYTPPFNQAVFKWAVPPISTTNGIVQVTGGGLVKDYHISITGPTLVLDGPPADTLLVPGTAYTVRWTASAEIENVHLSYTLDDATSLADYLPIAFNVPATDSVVWVVPDGFSPKCRLLVEDADNAALYSRSARFRIRGDELARLLPDSTYERFRPDRHGWSFVNSTPPIWTPAYWQQFDYLHGDDPFAQKPYPEWFTEPPVAAGPSFFPDWPAFVRAFGTDQTYEALLPGLWASYNEVATAKYGAIRQPWGGSCSGMAIAALMAFGAAPDFAQTYPSVGLVGNLFDLSFSDARQEVINQLWVHWFGLNAQNHAVANQLKTPVQTLADVRQMLRAENRYGDAYLYLADSSEAGAHAVLPYKVTPDPGNANRRWLYIYDPNWPGDSTKVIVVDSTANAWFYTDVGTAGWGGTNNLYLMDPMISYFSPALLPQPVTTAASVPAGKTTDGLTNVYVTPNANATLLHEGGGQIGYANGQVFTTLGGAIVDLPPTGRSGPPAGYRLPDGAYQITLSAFQDSTASALVFADSAIYSYYRSDATTGQRDVLAWGEHLGVRNDDPDAKTIVLQALAPTDTEARVFRLSQVTLRTADSLTMAVLQSERLQLVNPGGEKSATLHLRHTRADTTRTYRYLDLRLESQTTLTIQPAWGDTTLPVQVLLDRGHDGTVDDTMDVAMTLVGVEEHDDTKPGVPTGYLLAANYPNPFNPITTIRYSLPEPVHVRLRVYDLLGREVALLADRLQAAGTYEAVFDATGLPSGVYLYRLEAGRFTQIRAMTLVK